jgi:hypothetical protein
LSPIYGADIKNNILEFLGMVVTVWLAITKCTKLADKRACILALGNNMSAIGWLYKSSKLMPDSLYYQSVQMIAQKLACLITNSTHCLASQYI